MDNIIILAEDAATCQSASEILLSAGFDCKTLQTRVDIYKMLLNFEHDIVLLDGQMLGFHSGEISIFIRRLVRLNSIKVCVMSKSSDDFDTLQSADPDHQENYVYVQAPGGLLDVLKRWQ
ncbi:MAG TPA: hypothetical protein VKQ72_15160 [Aggregatilineales bacterium]|nr:hypothetical protein [Aggregatilineales bacterium]